MRAHLLTVLAWLTPIAAAAQDAPPTVPNAGGLAVTSSFADGRWLDAEDPLELQLSAPLHPEEGRLAVVIDRTDWTDLFEPTASGLRLAPGRAPLPRGESQLAVYVVSTGGEWTPLAQFPLRVLRAGGFEQVAARPTVEIASVGQAASDRRPPQPGERERFHDMKGTFGVLTTLKRGGLTTRGQANVVGVSYEAEALRFATEGASAPAVDLADYLIDLEHQRVRLSVGHVQWDAHRHLASGFASRGVASTVKVAPAVDLSLHAMNGTSIVGWSNFSGLERRSHQVRGATLGLELKPSRPGALRVAASWIEGSLQPLTGFTEGLVNDAETSQGGGLRVTATDTQARLQIDAGYSRSRFDNPIDPLLAQDLELVVVRETVRDARYLDASYAILQGARIGRTQSNLTAAVRHSRVDPLYRSVAAAVQADELQNTLELNGGVGQYASQFTWTEGRDNLDELASLLTTKTRTASWSHALPLGSLRREPAAWLPTLTVALNWQHQFGDGLPEESLFSSLSHVPDQKNATQAMGLEWTAERWRAGYNVNRSFQDNRQPGRERADLETLVHTVGLAFMPRPALELAVDLSFEDAENREVASADLTRRIGVNGNWRPVPRTTLNAVFSTTLTGNDPETRDGRATDVNVQLSQTLAFLKRRPDWLNTQLFVRFSRQTLRSTDRLFGLVDRQEFWSINTGLTFRLF